MGLFDVKANQAVRISAIISATLPQKFTVKRRIQLSDDPLTPMGDWHYAGDSLYFGPTGSNMEYEIVGYWYTSHSAHVSKQRAIDDGTVVVYYHEDANDNDFNDLIVTSQRLTTDKGVAMDLVALKNLNQEWQSLTLEDGLGFGAVLSSCWGHPSSDNF